MATNVLGDGNTGGTNVVASVTEKLNLYGGTPVVQPAPAVAVGTDLSTVILELADLRAQMVAIGMITS